MVRFKLAGFDSREEIEDAFAKIMGPGMEEFANVLYMIVRSVSPNNYVGMLFFTIAVRTIIENSYDKDNPILQKDFEPAIYTLNKMGSYLIARISEKELPGIEQNIGDFIHMCKFVKEILESNIGCNQDTILGVH